MSGKMTINNYLDIFQEYYYYKAVCLYTRSLLVNDTETIILI